MTKVQEELLRLIAEGGTTEDREILAEAKLQAVYSMVNQNSPYGSRLLSNNILSRHAHRQVGAILTNAAIPYVVLKGAASAAYYPEPMQRTMGDVDVLVAPADLGRAEKAMREAGFAEEPEDNGLHKAFKRQGTTVEVHWRVNGIPDGNERFAPYLRDIIDRAEELDGFRVPTAFHHGLVLLLHTAGHMINAGIGLRHLLDWCYFAGSMSDQAFAELFQNPLRAVGLWRFAQMLTLVGIRFLQMPDRAWAHCDAEDSVLADLMEDILGAGNFGVKAPQRINQAKLIQANSRIQDHALLGALSAKVRQEWPISRKLAVLLPFGWVYVSVRHLRRIHQGRRPRLDVKEMVSGAGQRRNLYRELRLFEV